MDAREMAKRYGWKVAYRNIPRELNKVPDDMCRRAEGI
jgi:hypothetical protein